MKRKHWNLAEARLLRHHLSDAQLARVYGIATCTVWRRLGARRDMRTREQDAKALYRTGMRPVRIDTAQLMRDGAAFVDALEGLTPAEVIALAAGAPGFGAPL